MKQPIPRGWSGIDVGKEHHWVCLIDDEGVTVCFVKSRSAV